MRDMLVKTHTCIIHTIKCTLPYRLYIGEHTYIHTYIIHKNTYRSRSFYKVTDMHLHMCDEQVKWGDTLWFKKTFKDMKLHYSEAAKICVQTAHFYALGYKSSGI